MQNIFIENKDGKKGIMSVRENEVNKIVYFSFEDGSEDSIRYHREDSNDYIVDDLCEYHGYAQL
ncbi:MAG: Unknown protein [uncultured Sulfurovum sp.]|uniref:Uncharacterized protein n=1 Tax=uncultured Sulfurovum sp. TaxID=269237 RepID=A0A6S6SII7_9BACT|nr:MAG: Unknown protein [uncultured Sulfurovum sp.]